MSVEIAYPSEKYFPSFREALSFVAKERVYIEMIEAPPLEKVSGFQRDLISKKTEPSTMPFTMIESLAGVMSFQKTIQDSHIEVDLVWDCCLNIGVRALVQCSSKPYWITQKSLA